MDINDTARNLVDAVTLTPDVEDKVQHVANHLTVAYNAGRQDEVSKFAMQKLSGAHDTAELWAEQTVQQVTTFGEPVAFAIRYYHKMDNALREVLCSTEHAVLAELHVLLLKDDAIGVSVVRVNRNT